MTQEALAKRADLHVTYVGGIERGERNPALDNVNRIARALGAPLGEFFSVFEGSFASTHRRRPRRNRRAASRD